MKYQIGTVVYAYWTTVPPDVAWIVGRGYSETQWRIVVSADGGESYIKSEYALYSFQKFTFCTRLERGFELCGFKRIK